MYGEKEDEKSDSICGDDDDAFVGDAAGVCGERVCVLGLGFGDCFGKKGKVG